jgi:hypothetical protein
MPARALGSMESRVRAGEARQQQDGGKKRVAHVSSGVGKG